MAKMKLTFLGTGTSQGVPVITCQCPVCQSDDKYDKRLRTSVLIESGDLNFTIDAGPDFRQQMLRENVQHLDAILVTHGHKDHVGGMDDVRAYNFKQKKAMDVYADEFAAQSIRTEFAYAFADDKYPGVPDFDLKLVSEQDFDLAHLRITPIPLMHLKLPVLGYRIGDLAYVTDANFIPEASWELLKGVKVLVINALRKEKHISHFNLEEALDVIAQLKPERAYLTHISHLMGKHEDINKGLPENVSFAYDGLKIEI
jgi:phosphoribosyl 1,2-cyclic phosphate phosphodiesterase